MALSPREYVAYTSMLIPALLLVAYLVYCGIILPTEINTHRLRYHPLEPFEMYTFPLSTWNQYNMKTKGISIVTYQEHKPHQYQYNLALFEDHNVTVSNDSTSRNISPKTWDEFTYIIEQNKPSTLFITQWSQTECTSFESCFQQHFPTDSDYIYTPIVKEHFININSHAVGDAFDETRDVATGAVLVILFGILIMLLLSIPSFDNNPSSFLVATAFIGAYFFWVFVTSIVPIVFCTPHDQNPSYWDEIRYSLSFTVGDYNPVWWVAGVINNGIWMYSLLFFCPAVCCCFCFLASCSCWCEIFSDEEKAEEISLCLLMVFIGIVVLGLVGMSLAYVVIFVANLTFWDEDTFNSLDDHYVIQCFMALICIWIVFPAFGCVVASIGKKHDLQIESINSLKESIVSVRNRTIQLTQIGGERQQYGTVETPIDDEEAAAMTQTEETQSILAN
eukprot:682803_1